MIIPDVQCVASNVINLNSNACERTFDALNSLYQSLLDMNTIEDVKNIRRHNQLGYAKEYGTIKICGPRRSGHTQGIIRFIENAIINKENFSCLIYTHNNHVKRMFVQRLNQYFCDHKYRMDYLDENQSHIYHYDHKNTIYYDFNTCRKFGKADMVIVDCASLFSSSQIDKIYEEGMYLMRYCDKFAFVFME